MDHRRVTLSDVARRAGVSAATASFVLSGRGGQPAGSPATRERVRAAAAELGYSPNEHARAMRTGRTGAIALALGDARDPWANELASTVSAHAQQVGLSTVVLVDESWYDFLRGRQFDCAFVTGTDATATVREQVRDLARHGSPLVVFSVVDPGDLFDVIRSDASPAVGEAYRLLRGRHERVHFLATAAVGVEAPLLTRGQHFAAAAAARGDRSADLLLTVPPTMGEARRAALEWLRSPGRPTAVVTQTGYLALALQAAAVQAGVSVPAELEIVSIGDVPEASSLFDPVSYYGAPEVFERVADVVVRRALAGPDAPPEVTTLEWTLHEGATTR